MKPIKLVMEGFGPYLEKTEIDFEKMDDGLTLISGNTGAGKTTIFDAICCALFGETSGKKRSFQQMRSESAGATDKTRVYFEFELKGEKYIVERNPEYLRPKIKGEDLTKETAKATLICPDGETVTAIMKVTEKIKKLLGIGKEEFRQIVMIAQNDFMAMIKDTKTNQEATFNRIFGTQIYRDFITKVKNEAKDFESQRDQVREQIQIELGRLGLEELSTDTNLFKGQILKELSERSANLREKLPRITEEVMELDEKNKINLKLIERAKILAEQFNELSEAYNIRKKLSAQKEAINQLTDKTRRAEDARDGIESIYKEYYESKKRLLEIVEQLKAKREEYSKASKHLNESKDKLEDYPQDKLIELKQEEAEIADRLPVYQEAAELNKTLIQLEQKRGQLIQYNNQKTQELNAIAEKLKSLVIYSNEYFSDLRNKNEAVHEKYKDSYERSEELKQVLNELQAVISTFIADHNKLEKSRIRLASIQKSYDEKFNIYILDQAHLLAEGLEPDKPCPVCGSLEHPHPAELTSNTTVTRQELDTLKAEVEALRKTIQNIAGKVGQEEGKIHTRKDNLTNYSRLFNEKNRHFLDEYINELNNLLTKPTSKDVKKNLTVSGKALSQCVEQIQEAVAFELSETERKATDINRNELKNQEAIQQKERLEKKQEDLEKTIEDQKNQIAEYNEKISAQNSLLEEKKKNLTFASLKEAEEALNHKQEQIKTFINKQELIQNQVNRETELVKQLEGEGKALRATKDTTEKEIERRSLSLNQKLKELKFTDLKDFLNSRLNPSEISQNNKIIQDYHFKVKSNDETIAKLEGQLKGKEAPDIDHLREEEKSLSMALEEKRNEYSEIEMSVKKINESQKVVEEYIKRYQKLDKECQVLYGLDKIISKRDGTFSQYVLSIYFKKVLRKANIKLAEMTNGLYQFKQTEEGKLEIEIFDASTGTTRDIKTLSGGETFTASLALALGFSEVVEEQNGGVRLDTIFIDEGFGSLDPEYLERAIDMLSKLSTERRVAIISHVEQLKERIDQQIVVEKGRNSSKIRIITR